MQWSLMRRPCDDRVRGRSWAWTLNNPTEEEVEHCENVIGELSPVRYLCYGVEVGESGTKHLQGYVYFKHYIGLKRAKLILGDRVHLEKCRGSPDQNIAYCSKDGDFHEFGDRPKSNGEKGIAQKERWRLTKALAVAGRLDEVDEEIYVRYYSTLKRIAADNIRHPGGLSQVCGVWLHGIAGSGKSYAVRDLFPGAYPKPVNKWWDGYAGENVVVLDDVDVNHSVLGHHLKIWGDRYSFIAEVKGAGVWIRPCLVIVTSQYSIEEIWSDSATRDALNRRYQSVKWESWNGFYPSLKSCISERLEALVPEFIDQSEEVRDPSEIVPPPDE